MAERLTRGLQLQAAGSLAEAEVLFRGLLAEAPRQAEFLYALGLLLYQRGQHLEAVELLRGALAARGPHPVLYSNLCAVCLAAGLYAEAVVHGRAAVAAYPDFAPAHFNLGAALRRLDRPEEAEVAFREAVRLDPGDVLARCNLGVVRQQLGRTREAHTELEFAVRLAPNHPQAHHDLGAFLLTIGQLVPGVEHLHRAVQLKPDFVEALDNLGLGLRYLARVDEAVVRFREALERRPDHVPSRNNLANALQSQGKIDEAIHEFQAVLQREPHNAFALAALSHLAQMGRYHVTEAEIVAIAQRAARTELPHDDRHQLHFAAAMGFEQLGDYAQAFAHYHAGNEIRKVLDQRRGLNFDPDAHDRYVDRLIATFTPEFFEHVRGFGLATELPIFVVGMMRSGTTLAEQILASHPAVFGAGELPLVETMAMALPQRLNRPQPYPEAATALDAPTAVQLGLDCEQQLRAWSATAQRVVDKMPQNFMHLGLLACILPSARLIHCRRDPVDTCLSCYIRNFGGSIPWSLDLGHLGRYYRAYARLMRHWRAALPVAVFELHYEQLTANQEAESRRLLAFCGLPWDDRCLRFHETERPVRTASVLQVRQPMYRSAVGRWQRYERFLGPLLDALRDDLA